MEEPLKKIEQFNIIWFVPLKWSKTECWNCPKTEWIWYIVSAWDMRYVLYILTQSRAGSDDADDAGDGGCFYQNLVDDVQAGESWLKNSSSTTLILHCGVPPKLKVYDTHVFACMYVYIQLVAGLDRTYIRTMHMHNTTNQLPKLILILENEHGRPPHPDLHD